VSLTDKERQVSEYKTVVNIAQKYAYSTQPTTVTTLSIYNLDRVTLTTERQEWRGCREARLRASCLPSREIDVRFDTIVAVVVA